MTDTNNNRDAAREEFWRYEEVYSRGHRQYMEHVRRLEDYYLGGGRQWRAEDRAVVEAEGRPCHEVNIIKQSVNAAAGYQIANRVDVSFLPRGGQGDERTAKLLGKVCKQVMDNTHYRYRETDAFLDGLIQQRGYLDLRMDYGDSVAGELKVSTLDPMDVLPDPDAKEYDPDEWDDCITTRWLTLRQIESLWGYDAAQEVRLNSNSYVDLDNFGSEDVDRSGFAQMPPTYGMGMGWYEDSARTRRYRILSRQMNEYVQSLTAIWPSGDMRVVEDLGRDKLAWLIDHGVSITRRRMRRVRWKVAAPDVCFLNELSPYPHITVVPYFPYFRRGRTVGMVDDMTSPQDMLNKFISQYAAVVNSSANGGWQGEADSLANMNDDEFEENASRNNLILLRKPNTQAFEKIKPNQVPTGLDKMIQYGDKNLRDTSGVDENLAGNQRDGMSGVAIQSLQYSSQQKLAIALDNLSRTRHLVHSRALDLIQRYMGNERFMRITETDAYGAERNVNTPLNQIQPDGSVLNDLTVGEYDVAINERPAQVTFDNSEFEQMKALRELGIPIPDAVMVRASKLADKSEIADALQEQAGQQAKDPEAEAHAALMHAQAKKAEAEAVTKAIEAQYSAIQTATQIVYTPQAARLADMLLRSGGYTDHDAPPIVPEANGAQLPAPGPHEQPDQNTHPLEPANPEVGLQDGLHDAPTKPPV